MTELFVELFVVTATSSSATLRIRMASPELRKLALISSLRAAPIFSGLPAEDVDRIAGYATLQKIPKGGYLFRENDEAAGFFIVRSGLINVHRRARDGREQVIHIFRPGESLAEVALMGPVGYPADARAELASEVLLIPRDEFTRHQDDNGSLAWRMLSSMSQHLRTLVTSLESLRLKDAETRFLHWLIRQLPPTATAGPARIRLGMAKGLLAGELGIRQETFSRILAKLRDLGWIEVRGQTILVADAATLRDAFEESIGSRSGLRTPRE